MHSLRAAALSIALLACSSEVPVVGPVYADRPPVTVTPDVLDVATFDITAIDIAPRRCTSDGVPCACPDGTTGTTRCLEDATTCACAASLDAGRDVAEDRALDASDARADVVTDAPSPDMGETCVDTVTDPNNCGGCGRVCVPPAHARSVCAVGVCIFSCLPEYGDCDGQAANGCEASLHTLENCGGCRAICETDNGTGACMGSTCTVVSCMAGFDDCDHMARNGCEADLQYNRLHCGVCGHVCPVSCNEGVCRD